MKPALLILTFFVLISCNDGNFETPSFNFEDSTIENCGNLILYKTNDSEALLIELDEDNTNNVFFTTQQDSIMYNLNDKIYYRTYDNTIPTNFFCSSIPPSTPKLNKEWIGGGKVIFKNVITDNNDGSFTYLATFTIKDMVLTNSTGNSIVYDTYDFGAKTGTFN